jgi:hypothetical protein
LNTLQRYIIFVEKQYIFLPNKLPSEKLFSRFHHTCIVIGIVQPFLTGLEGAAETEIPGKREEQHPGRFIDVHLLFVGSIRRTVFHLHVVLAGELGNYLPTLPIGWVTFYPLFTHIKPKPQESLCVFSVSLCVTFSYTEFHRGTPLCVLCVSVFATLISPLKKKGYLCRKYALL